MAAADPRADVLRVTCVSLDAGPSTLIRVGIGGWVFPPWRGEFYPAGLPQPRELEFASRHLTAIEINSTFHRTHNPQSFRRWAAETPDDFVFTLKGPRFAVSRPRLDAAGPGITRFLESGITELGAKLGPILWQLGPTRPFDEAEIAAFLDLLPSEAEGRELSHVLEVRHGSFVDPRFVALARSRNTPVVVADSPDYPAIADITGPLVYARLQRSDEAEPTGYPIAELHEWARRARIWAAGGCPADLAVVGTDDESGAGNLEPSRFRPVFIFFIDCAKERAPAAAQALLRQFATVM